MLMLGIETSCDDSAAAVVRDGKTVLSNVSANQDAFHERFGGIVPEVASRRHLDVLTAVIDDAMLRAECSLHDLDAIAVTAGPGLIGSLVIGVASAKALAFAHRLPLYAVNHLHGHIFAPFLDIAAEPEYPFLALLVSGGHSQLVRVGGPCDFTILGKTRDDAAGEAFDKTARIMGLPYPGGPVLDRLAEDGDPTAIAFPRNRAQGDELDLSFSGLKTAARRFLESDTAGTFSQNDIAASFRAAVIDVLIDRVNRAASREDYRMVVASGGVAANALLRRRLEAWGTSQNIRVLIPERQYCTDNAAMIAAAATRQGVRIQTDALTLGANPRLPFVMPDAA